MLWRKRLCKYCDVFLFQSKGTCYLRIWWGVGGDPGHMFSRRFISNFHVGLWVTVCTVHQTEWYTLAGVTVAPNTKNRRRQKRRPSQKKKKHKHLREGNQRLWYKQYRICNNGRLMLVDRRHSSQLTCTWKLAEEMKANRMIALKMDGRKKEIWTYGRCITSSHSKKTRNIIT